MDEPTRNELYNQGLDLAEFVFHHPEALFTYCLFYGGLDYEMLRGQLAADQVDAQTLGRVFSRLDRMKALTATTAQWN